MIKRTKGTEGSLSFEHAPISHICLHLWLSGCHFSGESQDRVSRDERKGKLQINITSVCVSNQKRGLTCSASQNIPGMVQYTLAPSAESDGSPRERERERERVDGWMAMCSSTLSLSLPWACLVDGSSVSRNGRLGLHQCLIWSPFLCI